MKPGKPVIYVNAAGEAREGVVDALTGAGPSGYKRLSVTVEGDAFEDLPHASDAAEGVAYWIEVGERVVKAVQRLARAVKGARTPKPRTRRKR
jgi:hypothetical protein